MSNGMIHKALATPIGALAGERHDEADVIKREFGPERRANMGRARYSIIRRLVPARNCGRPERH